MEEFPQRRRSRSTPKTAVPRYRRYRLLWWCKYYRRTSHPRSQSALTRLSRQTPPAVSVYDHREHCTQPRNRCFRALKWLSTTDRMVVPFCVLRSILGGGICATGYPQQLLMEIHTRGSRGQRTPIVGPAGRGRPANILPLIPIVPRGPRRVRYRWPCCMGFWHMPPFQTSANTLLICAK